MRRTKKSSNKANKSISKKSKSIAKSNKPIKIKKTGFMWECICGNIVYGDKTPFECKKCLKIDNFTQVPHELVEEREKDLLGEEDEI